MTQVFARANELIPLRPDEYWRLTPAELAQMLSGAAKREERELERVAWAVAHELNVAGKVLKKPVTMDQLLGRKKTITRAIDPFADFETLWGRIQERPPEEN